MTESLRYKYLAYYVLRDAIGFFYGIPKFLESLDRDAVIESKLQKKIKDKQVSEQQIIKYRSLIEKSVDKRIKYLEEDYVHCQDVLFKDNVWLQLLDIDPEFFKVYLNKLPKEISDELAIVPSWTVRDHSLKRSYYERDYSLN